MYADKQTYCVEANTHLTDWYLHTQHHGPQMVTAVSSGLIYINRLWKQTDLLELDHTPFQELPDPGGGAGLAVLSTMEDHRRLLPSCGGCASYTACQLTPTCSA